jgi:hypothetical protein
MTPGGTILLFPKDAVEFVLNVRGLLPEFNDEVDELRCFVFSLARSTMLTCFIFGLEFVAGNSVSILVLH